MTKTISKNILINGDSVKVHCYYCYQSAKLYFLKNGNLIECKRCGEYPAGEMKNRCGICKSYKRFSKGVGQCLNKDSKSFERYVNKFMISEDSCFESKYL